MTTILSMPSADADYLIQRYVSGDITEGEAFVLEEFLDDNPLWERRLLEHRELHALLDEVCQSDEFVQRVVASRFPLQQPFKLAVRKEFRRFAIASVVCLALLSTLGFLFFPALTPGTHTDDIADSRSDPSSIPLHYRYALPSDNVKKSDEEIAFFEINSFVVWDETTEICGDAGDHFKPGWLRFRSGVMAILFDSGARLVIEGPAEIQLIDSNRADCIRGNVTVNIPEKAIGFQLNVPQTTVVDLGTSFGVEVDASQTTVHVIEGEIELHGSSGAKDDKLSMYGNDAVVVKHGDVVGPMILSSLSTAQNAVKSFQSALSLQVAREWEKHCLQAVRLDHDPSVPFHFDFSENCDSTRQIVNRSVLGSDKVPVAQLTGGEFVDGRLSGMKALKFRQPDDMVDFNMPDSYKKMTFATRLRIDGFDHVYNAIMTTHSFEPGQIHWHVLYNGVIEIGINADEDRPGLQFQTKPILFSKLGQWIDLAVTVDAEAQEVGIYLDGVEVFRKSDKHMPPEFHMKNGIFGNWTFPDWWVVVHSKFL